MAKPFSKFHDIKTRKPTAERKQSNLVASHGYFTWLLQPCIKTHEISFHSSTMLTYILKGRIRKFVINWPKQKHQPCIIHWNTKRLQTLFLAHSRLHASTNTVFGYPVHKV